LFIFSMPLVFRHLWQLKIVVFLHDCLIRAVLLSIIRFSYFFIELFCRRIFRALFMLLVMDIHIYLCFSCIWQHCFCLTILDICVVYFLCHLLLTHLVRNMKPPEIHLYIIKPWVLSLIIYQLAGCYFYEESYKLFAEDGTNIFNGWQFWM
jgi:hypothetical protein